MKTGQVNLNKDKALICGVFGEILNLKNIDCILGSETLKRIADIHIELYTEDYRVRRGIKSASELDEFDWENIESERAYIPED